MEGPWGCVLDEQGISMFLTGSPKFPVWGISEFASLLFADDLAVFTSSDQDFQHAQRRFVAGFEVSMANVFWQKNGELLPTGIFHQVLIILNISLNFWHCLIHMWMLHICKQDKYLCKSSPRCWHNVTTEAWHVTEHVRMTLKCFFYRERIKICSKSRRVTSE